MSWVNLNDVYVNQTGGTIAGDLSVNGALTVNDGKGTNTTYNVANEITTLRDSVSHYEDQYGWNIVEIGGAKICAYSYDISLFAGGNEYVRFTEVPLPDGLFTETPHAVVCKKQTGNSSVDVSVNMNVSSVSTDSVLISINNGSGGIPDKVRMPFTLLAIGW